MPTAVVVRALLAAVLVVAPGFAAAQEPVTPPPQELVLQEPVPPPPPPPLWAGTLGAGLALTKGNSDTSTTNVAYELRRDSGSDFFFKSTGLYLRGNSEGETTVDRAALDGRVDYRLTQRLSAFALTTYARDRFKAIDYMLAPTGGFSFSVLPEGRIEWTTDGSLGLVFEKNTDLNVQVSGAIVAGERLIVNFTEATRFIHTATGLWKMDSFGDSFYTFSAGIATSVASRLELKTEFLNTYKRRPTDPTLQKSDQSVVLSIVYKF